MTTKIDDMTQIIGYIRVSTDKQDLENQRNILNRYCVTNKLIVDAVFHTEISSRKTEGERKITLLIQNLHAGDTLIVSELSRIGRSMHETIHIINRILEKDVNIIFINQPELSTKGEHQKLLVSLYSYLAETERTYISMRTKDGLDKARKEGKILGRPKGAKNKNPILLDEYRDQIVEFIRMNIPTTTIAKLLKRQNDKIKYNNLYKYIMNNNLSNGVN